MFCGRGWYKEECREPRPQTWYQSTQKCEEGNWPVQEALSLSFIILGDQQLGDRARAACFWTQTVWTEQWEEDARGISKTGVGRHVDQQMEELGITLPSWQVLMMGDDRMKSMQNTDPEDFKKTSLRQAKEVYWQKMTKKEEA